MSLDVAIIETENGGDAVLSGNDLVGVENDENNIYLGIFGGNVAQVTPTDRVVNEQALDYWANSLFDLNDRSVQLNSLTEKALKEINLTSAGRVLIENAIKEDLKFMSDFGGVTVETAITATDRLEVLIRWTLLNDEIKIARLVFETTDEGDFFLFDFNNDFLV